MKLLVAVDGSDCSAHVVDYLATKMPWLKQGAEVHLLNVQPPVPGGGFVAAAVGHEQLKKHHQEEGMAALKPAMDRLNAAGVPFAHHIVVGEAPAVIAEFAKEKNCDQIVMGSRGLGATASFVMGSVATKVLNLADRPVLLVK